MNEVTHIAPRFLSSLSSFRLHPFVVLHQTLSTFNLSVTAYEERLYFALRHSNLTFTGNLHNSAPHSIRAGSHDIVNQTSFGVMTLPENGPVTDCTFFPGREREFEDLRIFRYAGRWCGLGCKPVRSFPRVLGSRMQMVSFDDGFRIREVTYLASPTNAAFEKNWTPFPRGDELLIVYRPSPLDIYRLDAETKRMLPVYAQKAGPPWSGSSQFVLMASGTALGIVHRKFSLGGEVVYENAFMRIGEDFSTEISQPFHFLSYGVEFCAGLALMGDRIVCSFGFADNRAYVVSIHRDELDGLFKP